ncbi:MAG: L,D-transpeptidase family protein [Lachnospiraceae bacterium]|nr:L,D-transpeptidase family protein [Lachnospiraceae bacterium]
MSKKKIVLRTTFIVTLILAIGYFLLAIYYRQGFAVNTWINGVYCTGKSVEEVNSELLSFEKTPSIVIYDKDGNTYPIDFANLDYSCDYKVPLSNYLEEQNSFLWIKNISSGKEQEMIPAITYADEDLKKMWNNLPFVKEELAKESVYEIRFSEEKGYFLYDGISNRVDLEKAYALLVQELAEGGQNLDLDLKEADCYYNLSEPETKERVDWIWQKVEKFQNAKITFDMGDELRPVTKAALASFLKLDSQGEISVNARGSLILNEEAITEYVDALAEEYDTYQTERTFLSTRGDLITLSEGTYGTLIDREAEVLYLMETLFLEDVHSKEGVIHIPAYEKQGVVRGKNDIGDTYIEIDMTNQKMYYYEDGNLLIETDVVTGNARRNWDTPEGVNFVYGKQKNRVLRGPGYASFVKYWMPVNGNIGIHDASWRGEFGGTIYKTNGSHGCVNTPTDKMAELYEKADLGTPVIMFY